MPKEMQGASPKVLAAGRMPGDWRQSFFAEYYKELGDVWSSPVAAAEPLKKHH